MFLLCILNYFHLRMLNTSEKWAFPYAPFALLIFPFLSYAVEGGEIRRAKEIQSFPFSPYEKKAE